MSIQQVKAKIKLAPTAPGCYIYKNHLGEIIYVGKAVNIASRTKSYFQNIGDHDPKTRQLVKNIADVEFITTESEIEALLLETNLIKKHTPKYNVDKKDDKSYLWLMIDTSVDFPRIELVREKKKKTADYFGPYPSSMPLKRILKGLRGVFPYRSCNRVIKQEGDVIKSSDPKPCLYYYLNLCNAPCAGLIEKQEYRKNINKIKLFFNNRKNYVLEELKQEMEELAAAKKYEAAAKVRDQINDLKYITQRVHIKPDTDAVSYKKQKQDRYLQGLTELLERIDLGADNATKEFKIECYDISNIQGTNATGSMIAFVGGKMRKDLYRKFKIRIKDTPDDFAMMQEVFSRRFSQKNLTSSDTSFNTLPDLIIVDGGKGQLSVTYKVLNEMEINVPIVGLAKRNEDIFIIDEADGELKFKKRKMPHGTEARFLVQRVRDETHRFAIKYHRKLRSKTQTHSILDDIPGVGPITKKKLLRAFGSVAGIRKASDQEIGEIIKNTTTVNNIKKLIR